MSGSVRIKALLSVPLAVSAVLMLFLALGSAVVATLGIPPTLGLTLHIRLLGALPLLAGLLIMLWLFRYRKPTDLLVSTYVTFSKLRGASLDEPLGRTEQLVIRGPHRYVRHPLYLGVVLMVLGFWILLDHTSLILSAILMLLWFNFVVTPFEEKELMAMFGAQYEQYSRKTSRMIPLTKRRRKS